MSTDRVAVVTGAAGQDGYFLTQRLLADGWTVHAVVRTLGGLSPLIEDPSSGARLMVERLDVADAAAVQALLRRVRPAEIYNLAGQSSVSRSFADPGETWRSNADAVLGLLEAVRHEVPDARVYQASSGEMFGWMPGDAPRHSEVSPFLPQSPYAVAKAAAHLLCGAYRRAYDVRVACGILFNHESHRRPASFLTRKLVDHVRRLSSMTQATRASVSPLRMGNLAAQRDWGFAPDYVDGMLRIARQVVVRAQRTGQQPADDPGAYTDYVLATGQLHAVWELVDRAFALAGIPLVWKRPSDDVREWSADYGEGGGCAVIVDPELLRPSDPAAISADPSKAARDLGWSPRIGLDVFLEDMLLHG